MESLAGVDLSTIDEDSLRKIDYKFESDVLSLPRIVTQLKFSVGDNVVEVRVATTHTVTQPLPNWETPVLRVSVPTVFSWFCGRTSA